MYKLSIDNLNELFALIGQDSKVYAPIERAGQVEFFLWSVEEKVRLDALNTVKSAKGFFFPQTEVLYKTKLEGKKIEIEAAEDAEEPTVYFGVRACDVKSFDVLDKVFLSEPVDSYYAAKRKHGTIVSMACSKPADTCFCGLFGIDATSPAGDVVTWIVGDTLYWDSKTEKGEALTVKVKELLVDADDVEVKKQQTEVKEMIAKAPLHDLSLEGFGGDALDELFNSPKWEALSSACLGCGTCTFVCPTCQCYDIRDYDSGHGVQKFRCWDSCMYSDFTMMAHGNNRTTQLQRFRQRFMHKLVYFPANNDGDFSCVGCGRCLQKCPQSLNIVKVIKALGGKKND
ncbi:MAG: 4Fe-4S dicluster domain-containing protein [Lachnospira sp.]|nr:4Fe-4S dicluster domain-containing protein [Lachnospira sp.]